MQSVNVWKLVYGGSFVAHAVWSYLIWGNGWFGGVPSVQVCWAPPAMLASPLTVVQ